MAAIELDEPAPDLSNGSLGNSLEESESKSIESTAEILMADNTEHRAPSGHTKPKDRRVGASHVNTDGGIPVHEPYVLQALTRSSETSSDTGTNSS